MSESYHRLLSLRKQYESLATLREPFLIRARACSALTIPTLIPPLGHSATTPLPTPYQSLGARGVNNLSAKLLMTLFPPNQPNVKLTISESYREKLGASIGTVEKALSKAEQILLRDLETSGVRPAMSIALKHLLIGGNVLLYDDPDSGKLRVYSMTQFVVSRDPAGNVLRIIVKESVSPETLPKNLQEIVEAKRGKAQDASMHEKSLDLFTCIFLDEGRWNVYQELDDLPVPDSEGTYPLDKCPWHVARLNIVENQDYARSFVEEYYGDLKSLELLTKAMVNATMAAAKVVFLVKPNGVTEEDDLKEAEGGDVLTGNAEDVTTLHIEKRADFATAETRIQKLTEALSYAFLLNSAIQRAGERVTAQEIRYMANELESGLGGIYSSLSQEIQLPMLNSRMAALMRRGELPNLPKDIVQPMITTGIDALGRGNDAQKLMEFAKALSETFGPEAAANLIKRGEFISRLASAQGINPDGLAKSDEELAQEQMQAQQAAMAQAAIAPSINQAGQLAAQAQSPSA